MATRLGFRAIVTGRSAEGILLLALTGAIGCGEADLDDGGAGPPVGGARDLDRGQEQVGGLTGNSVWTRSVRIGQAVGPDHDVLYRVSAGFRDSDGRVFVANGGTNEIRVYARSGEFLNAFGGDGDGPGEFRNLRDVVAFGVDSILALDSRGGRLTVFAKDGGYGRSFSVSLPDQHANIRRVWVVGERNNILLAINAGVDPRRIAFARDSIRILRIPNDSSEVREVLTVADRWWESYRTATAFGLRAAAAGPAGVVSVGETRIASTSNDEARIDLWTIAGGYLGRWDDRDHPRWGRHFGSSVQSREDADRRGRFYAQLLWSDAEELWMGDQSDDGTGLRIWTIVDVNGAVTGTAALPSNARLLHVGEDFLLLRSIDAADVERVEVWRRAPPSP